MLKFSKLEDNLRKAGYVLFAEAIGVAILAAMVSLMRISPDLVVLLVWLVNLPAAWFLARAARVQGRSAWWTGLSSLPPLLAAVTKNGIN
ncbi:hypothetical protein N7346_17465 [Aeromonas caviae]|uniref:hypothetical protein n=1 Tax=Aeromonas caviae TaxID=648 RepID=UPI0024490A0B|nr:hypothetical protein [Aeromonas caviae]MDH0318821.1 hypothetical protein [Aeromonas caviae]